MSKKNKILPKTRGAYTVSIPKELTTDVENLQNSIGYFKLSHAVIACIKVGVKLHESEPKHFKELLTS